MDSAETTWKGAVVLGAHVAEEADKVALVFGVAAVVVDGALDEVAVGGEGGERLLVRALVVRRGQLQVDGLVEADGEAVAVVDGEVGRRVDGLEGVVVDVHVVGQRPLHVRSTCKYHYSSNLLSLISKPYLIN